MRKPRRRKKHQETVHVKFITGSNHEKKVVLAVPAHPGLSTTRQEAATHEVQPFSSQPLQKPTIDSTAPQVVSQRKRPHSQVVDSPSTSLQSWWTRIPNWARYSSIFAIGLGIIVFLSRKNTPPDLSNMNQPIAITSDSIPPSSASMINPFVSQSTMTSSSEFVDEDELPQPEVSSAPAIGSSSAPAHFAMPSASTSTYPIPRTLGSTKTTTAPAATSPVPVTPLTSVLPTAQPSPTTSKKTKPPRTQEVDYE